MPNIDVGKIPQVEVERLASTLIDAVKLFYQDAKNVQEFEAWKKNKEGNRNA